MSTSAPRDDRTPHSIGGTGGYPEKSALRSDSDDLVRYQRLAEDLGARRTLKEEIIPPRYGRAFLIDPGQILRVSCPEGPQVADFIAFSKNDPTEHFWSARTRVIHGGHLNVGDHLWSCPPRTRRMLTMIADTVEHKPLQFAARSHDLLFCRCDSRLYEVVHGIKGARNCNDNLAEAIAAFGLRPSDVHDPFNIFMTTGMNDQGKPFYLPSDSRKGDYVELYSHIPCLVAISACPGGSAGPRSNPLGITIYAVAEHS
jgi:uncharacterized protein YcgI (DUF1989 family)